MYFNLDRALQHHGVKGMRWGVRRYQPYPKGEGHKGKFLGRVTSKIGQKYKGRISKFEKRYIDKGVSPKEAKALANRRVNGEIALAAVAATVVTVASIKGAKVFGREYVDKVVKAGTPLQTLSAQSDRDFSRPFYAAYNKADKEKYKGLFAGAHLGGRDGEKQVFKHLIKSPETLKIASHNSARKALGSAVKNNPEFGKLFEQVTNSSTVDRKSYEKFNRLLATMHNVDFQRDTNNLKPFYDKLKEMGYNGLLDINDQKYSGYRAKNPSVIFDKGVKAVQTVKSMNPWDIDNALDRQIKNMQVRETVQKYGKHTLTTVGAVSAGAVYSAEMEGVTAQVQTKRRNTAS